MNSSRSERLRRLTSFKVDGFSDNSKNRQRLILHLLKNLGYEEKVREIDDLLKDQYLALNNLTSDEINQLKKRQTVCFHEAVCDLLRKSLKHRTRDYKLKDLGGFHFWTIVDDCLLEIGLRNQNKSPSKISAPSTENSQESLDQRVKKYINHRPKLNFPLVFNASVEENSLLEDVLSDHRGISTGAPFDYQSRLLYDRRYVAALRAELSISRRVAEQRLKKIRELENQLNQHRDKCKLISAPSKQNLETQDQEIPQDPFKRCLSDSIRDLSHELALLPDRLLQDLNRERQLKAFRNQSSKPKYLENIINLARVVSYDLMTLEMVNVGICRFKQEHN